VCTLVRVSWRWLAYGALGVVVLVGLVVTLAWVFQRRLIYLPDGPVPPAHEVLGGARDVGYTTSDGLRLGWWFVPAAGSDTGVAVLVAPGNAGNRAGRAPLAEALRDRGMSVLLVDYRGYGGNPGDPSEDGLRRDIRAARAFLAGEIGPERIVYFGESLGAAVVTDLAAEHPPHGLLLRSPFVDLAEVAGVHYPLLPARWLLKDRFPVADTIRRVRVPTTVVLGTADEVVPAEQSRTVAAAAGGPATVIEVPGASHNDPVLFTGEQVIGAVERLASL
jgi:fermentation-respiration switch protein FrsA (DUF1100 family)